MTRRPRPEVVIDGADLLYAAGYSTTDIASAMECAARTVMLRLRADGVAIRRCGHAGGRVSQRASLDGLRREIRDLKWRLAEEMYDAVAAFVAREED
jgi:hypothetical protein